MNFIEYLDQFWNLFRKYPYIFLGFFTLCYVIKGAIDYSKQDKLEKIAWWVGSCVLILAEAALLKQREIFTVGTIFTLIIYCLATSNIFLFDLKLRKKFLLWFISWLVGPVAILLILYSPLRGDFFGWALFISFIISALIVLGLNIFLIWKNYVNKSLRFWTICWVICQLTIYSLVCVTNYILIIMLTLHSS